MMNPSAVAAVGVLTVDDQAVFRAVARELVAPTPGFDLVGEASSAKGALEAAARLRPALVLMDVRMPGMDGIEAARRVTELSPRRW